MRFWDLEYVDGVLFYNGYAMICLSIFALNLFYIDFMLAFFILPSCICAPQINSLYRISVQQRSHVLSMSGIIKFISYQNATCRCKQTLQSSH